MGKTVVITGAGAGLGRALARSFAGDGDTVVLLGRTLSKIEKVAGEAGGALALACDVASAESVTAAFAEIAKRYGKINVLINNAAVYEPTWFKDATNEQIGQALMTNAAGPMFCARAAIPLMDRGATIINVSSEVVEMTFPMLSLYQASKAALERFSKSLGEELRPHGIRVSFVRCGPMMDEEKVLGGDPQVLKQFHEAMLKVGINPRERGVTHFNSVTGVFRALVDLPADLETIGVMLGSRRP